MSLRNGQGPSGLHNGKTQADDPTTLESNQPRLDHKRHLKSYTTVFSVHGLSRVFHGQPWERYAWVSVFLLFVIFILIIVTSRIREYLTYGIYTDMEIKFTENIRFPSFTICPSNIIDLLQTWCGVQVMKPAVLSQFRNLTMTEYCTREKRMALTMDNSGASYINHGLEEQYKHPVYGIKVSTLDEQMNPAPQNFYESLAQYHHNCITWNPKGNVTKGKYGLALVTIELFKQFDSYYILPHGPDEYIDIGQFMSSNHAGVGQFIQIAVEGTTLHRLPAPYPSKCRTENMLETSPLVKKYSRQLCNDLKKPINKLKRCGTVDDFSYPFLDENFIAEYEHVDMTFGDFHKCLLDLKEQSKSGQIDDDDEDCDPQCSEQKFEVRHMGGQGQEFHAIELLISLDNLETETFVVEKALYQFNEVVANIGGMISLLNGLSICSTLEILIALGLYVKFKKEGRRTVYTM